MTEYYGSGLDPMPNMIECWANKSLQLTAKDAAA